MLDSASRFQPPAWLRGPHRQTLWANYAHRPTAAPADAHRVTTEIVDTADGDRLRAHWWWRQEPAPVLLLLHGLTGCAESPQVMGLAVKAARRGFHVVRADLRNASGRTPSVGVGHAGRSEDVVALLRHVAVHAPRAPVAIAGYSLGGNVALKAAGEMGDDPAPGLVAVAAISVPIDLDVSCRSIDAPGNRLYRAYFLRRLQRTVARRRQRHPGSYPEIELRRLTSLRAFDNAIVAPTCGFDSAEDYYRRCSALRLVAGIRVPTLLVQSRDDPFIPFHPFADERVRANPAIELLATERGGHVGFYAARTGGDPDAYWAENRALDHCARHAGLA